MGKRIIRFLMKCIIKLICRIRVTGYEEIEKIGDKPCIVASNHIGRLDGFLAYIMVGRNDIIFTMAKKYKTHPFFHWIVGVLDGIWVDQYGNDIGAFREVRKQLKKGGILFIAPEGTRSRTASLGPGKMGAAYLASIHCIPVFPVAITGSEDGAVFSILRTLKRARVNITVGKPFLLKPLESTERHETLERYTEEIMCRIAALLPPRYRGYYSGHPRLKELLYNGC